MHPLPPLTGPLPTLPTLFGPSGLDLDAQARVCGRMVEAGLTTLVVGGLEGEGPNLSAAELTAVVAAAVDRAALVGLSICASSTEEACRQAGVAAREGAAFVVISPPPYNRPTHRGVRLHLEAVGEACGLPIVLREDQARTRIALTPEMISELCEEGTVSAVVLPPGDMRLSHRIHHFSRGTIPCLAGSDSDAILIQCDDRTAWLSPMAVVDPQRCRALHLARLAGQWSEAGRLTRELGALMRALDLDEPAVIVKAALAQLGLAYPDVRLPLAPVAADAERIIAQAIRALELDGAPAALEPC